MLVLDDELAKAAEISESGLKLEIAILLFQKNKITSRKAAKLAGINFLEFWKELSKRNMDLIGEKTYIDETGNLTL
jgi:predicted HTH domain antitoxin